MRRPKNSRGHYLARMELNTSTGYYEIEKEGILYQLPFDLMVKLKEARGSTVAEWYAALQNADKKRVIRTGEIPRADDDFYPDVSYD